MPSLQDEFNERIAALVHDADAKGFDRALLRVMFVNATQHAPRVPLGATAASTTSGAPAASANNYGWDAIFAKAALHLVAPGAAGDVMPKNGSQR